MFYSAFSAKKSLIYYKKLNIITVFIFYISILFPICAIMFTVQLEKGIEESNVKYAEQTMVFYLDEYKFTKQDMDKIAEDNKDRVAFIIPMDIKFQNVLIDNKYKNPLVLTTNKQFLKVNNMNLNKNYDIEKSGDTSIIVGKNLVTSKSKEIVFNKKKYNIDAITYNFLYPTYVIIFDEEVSSHRIEVVLRNNNSQDKNQIIQYMNNNFNGTIQYKTRDKIYGTVAYYEDFSLKAILITGLIAIYSVINILSLISMKFEEEKKAFAIRFAVGAKKRDILLQNFMEQLLLFFVAAIGALASLPIVVHSLNTNLSFIRLYYDLKVLLLTSGVVVACTCFFSIVFSAKLKYKNVIVSIKG